MAISYVGAGTPASRTGTPKTWVLGVPSGTAAGDLLVAILATPQITTEQGVNVTAPTGWTQLFAYAAKNASNQFQACGGIAVYTKTAVASEAASYTFSEDTSGQTKTGVMLAYRGAAITSTYATSYITGNANSTAPTITTSGPQQYVLNLFANSSGGTTSYFGAPSSAYSVRYADTSATAAALEAVDVLQASGGTSNPATVYNYSQYSVATMASVAISVMNAAPNAPTLNSPATGAGIDRTQAQTFSWTPSDPDAGDSQSAFTFRYRVQGSTGAWTSTSQTTSATSYTVAANTFADSTQYEWQVATTDSLGAVGPYSASNVFTAATPPPAPTITVPASGATVTAPTSPLTFTAPNVTASRWRVMGDTSGSANTTVIRPGATTNDASLRTFTVDGLTDNTSVHFQVAVQYQGLWGPWADRQVAVAFTLPAIPVVALTMLPQTDPTNPASLSIAITNPTPSGGQPAVVSHEVYVNDGDGLGHKKLAAGLAPGATYVHRTPAAAREYSGGPVRVAAVAASGAKSFGTGTG